MRAEAVLRDALHEMEGYSSSIGHELRTPLRAIDGFSARLLKDYAPLLDEEGKRLFAQVRWNAQRMGRLIDDHLSFSQAGRTVLRLGTVHMADAARLALKNTRADNEHIHAISVSIDDLPDAHGDPRLLEKVWEVLLANAVKFSSTKETPEIRVEGRLENGDAVYSVRDNGVGFDMQYVDKLFGVFHRLHGHNDFEGTGVGLALVKRIVTRHGGRVWAEGKEGEGATFSFALPVEQTTD